MIDRDEVEVDFNCVTTLTHSHFYLIAPFVYFRSNCLFHYFHFFFQYYEIHIHRLIFSLSSNIAHFKIVLCKSSYKISKYSKSKFHMPVPTIQICQLNCSLFNSNWMLLWTQCRLFDLKFSRAVFVCVDVVVCCSFSWS